MSTLIVSWCNVYHALIVWLCRLFLYPCIYLCLSLLVACLQIQLLSQYLDTSLCVYYACMETYSFSNTWLMAILQPFSEQIHFTRTKLLQCVNGSTNWQLKQPARTCIVECPNFRTSWLFVCTYHTLSINNHTSDSRHVVQGWKP